jgi:hypothetical protein
MTVTIFVILCESEIRRAFNQDTPTSCIYSIQSSQRHSLVVPIRGPLKVESEFHEIAQAHIL